MTPMPISMHRMSILFGMWSCQYRLCARNIFGVQVFRKYVGPEGPWQSQNLFVIVLGILPYDYPLSVHFQIWDHRKPNNGTPVLDDFQNPCIATVPYTSFYPVNIVLRKPAYQSSTYYWSRTTSFASNANDGDFRTDWIKDKTCSHTKNNNPQDWWAVDLLRSYTVAFVTLTNSVTRGK